MPSIGTISVNLHTVDKDEVVYALSGNTVSHADLVALKRNGGGDKPLRANVRFERGFAMPDGTEKPVTVSIATVVPAGVNTGLVQTFVSESLTQAAAVAAGVAVTGDIHL